MRRLILILTALVLVATACGDDNESTPVTTSTTPATPVTDPTTTTITHPTTTTTEAVTTTGAASTTTTTPEEIGDSGLRIAQVGFDAGPQEGWVVIENAGSEPVSLAGHFLCQRPGYFRLPDVDLGPGDVFWIAVDEVEGLDGTAPSIGAGGALGAFSQVNGEMGLYDSNSFGDPDSILSYVEWGSTGHGRSSVAVAAGLWFDGEFVDGLDESIGAIFSEAGQPAGAGAWQLIEIP